MPEEKQVRRKSKKSFFVVTADANGKLLRHYTGPDRKKARTVAEKLLTENDVESVNVLTVTAAIALKKDDLRSMLPKDSF